jgi:hypothetical protein
MVAGMHRHLTSLRRMKHDGGWIGHLLAEAENERYVIICIAIISTILFNLIILHHIYISMHLLTWMKIAQPTLLERGLVVTAQVIITTRELV